MIAKVVILMSRYDSWNDYFLSHHDNKKSSLFSGNFNTHDIFEYRYYRKYGTWFDHDYFKFTTKYGAEKADRLIKKRVDALNLYVKEKAQKESSQYDWHDIPDNEFIPF